MGYGVSIFLLAVGAILTWGVQDTAAGIDVAAIGVILMLVGLLGLALTVAFWSSFSPFAGNAPFRRTYAHGGGGHYDDDEVVVERAPRRRRTVLVREQPTTVVREEPPTRERTVVVEEPDDRL